MGKSLSNKDLISEDPFHIKNKLMKQSNHKDFIDLSRGEPINTPDITSDIVFMFFWNLSLTINEKLDDINLQTVDNNILMKTYYNLLNRDRYITITAEIELILDNICTQCKLEKVEIIKIIISEIRGEDYLNPAGSEIVRSMIAAFFNQYLKLAKHWKKDNVILTIGGSEAIGTLFEICDYTGFLNSDSSVALFAPVYSPYKYLVEKGGYKLYTICGSEKNNFFPDLEDLKKFKADIKKENIKALIIVNPSNPTGYVLPELIRKNIAVLAKENNLLIVEDIVYAQFLEKGKKKLKDFYSLYEDSCSNTLFIGSASKFYQSTGTRFGFAMISNEFNAKFTKIFKDKYSLKKYDKIDKEDVDFRTAFIRAKGPDPWGSFYHTHHVPAPTQWMSLFRYLVGNKDGKVFAKELKARWIVLNNILLKKNILDVNTENFVPYYSLINMKEVVEIHNPDYEVKIQPFELFEKLFMDEGVSFIFAAPFFMNKATQYQWFVRFSLANQKRDRIEEAAKRIVGAIKNL